LIRLWVWDTSFISCFTKYAPDRFPGIESFDNFYETMYGDVETPLFIQHADNPPLFAWAELEHYRITGDKTRLEHVVQEKKFLQKHFEFLENSRRGLKLPYMGQPNMLHKHILGFYWSDIASGMDNTPRGRTNRETMLWFDALAQQAMAARNIADILMILDGEKAKIETYLRYYKHARYLLDTYYWNDEVGVYFDISANEGNKQIPVITPATCWPMMAKLCSREQAARLNENAKDPHIFGGHYPWPSLAPTDPEFVKDGRYWRGGVWLPTAYMATKALEKYGYFDTANMLAERLVKQLSDTYKIITLKQFGSLTARHPQNRQSQKLKTSW